MVSRLGGLLTLTSSGCSVDFGPAHFLPLHPLVTYRYASDSLYLSFICSFYKLIFCLSGYSLSLLSFVLPLLHLHPLP